VHGCCRMNLLGQLYDADDPQRLDSKRNLKLTTIGIVVWFIFSFLCITLHALNAAFQGPGSRLSNFLSVLSNSALVGVAFTSVGALLGFIFGIPRAAKTSPPTSPPPVNSSASSGPGNSAIVSQDDRRFTPNTNLEEISDWLTKILVGAGLVQLAVLPAQLKRLADFFHASMPLTSEAALMIILDFFVLGFMGSYLLTRLFLQEAFRTVEESMGARLAITRVAQDLLLEISPTASKEERDAKYESYIYTCLYLDPPEGFERAIKACLEYLQAAGDNPNPRILAYQAMAYGQKYDWEQKRGAPKDSLASLRTSALDAIKRAVTLQPELRQLLRTTWDPNDPTKLRGEENDLEVFFADSDFKKILNPQGT
jgi:hypothetical protein